MDGYLASLASRAARPVIDQSHNAPVVQVIAWLMLIFSILSFVAHSLTKVFLGRRLTTPDSVLAFGVVLAIAETSTLLSLGRNVGNSPEGLTEQEVDNALKALYVGNIISVAALAAIKSSVLLPLLAVTPIDRHRVAIYATITATIVWGIGAAFSFAFQCPAPERWRVADRKCIDIRTFQTWVASVDMALDLAVVIIPTSIILPVKMPWGDRFAIVGGFWFRVLTIAATAVQLYFLQQLIFDDTYLKTVWPSTILKEVVQATSIMTACIPFLKPFLVRLETGFLQADDIARTTSSNTVWGPKRSDFATTSKLLHTWGSSYMRIRNKQAWGRSLATSTFELEESTQAKPSREETSTT
ncbi:hypothetical protein F4780DRAFT_752837 [Xylariomycetidae sp. FL0641]|nr:hypothetical protein F4780DRAFT_752837 [Xylariomycetidae sp. FL0641]